MALPSQRQDRLKGPGFEACKKTRLWAGGPHSLSHGVRSMVRGREQHIWPSLVCGCRLAGSPASLVRTEAVSPAADSRSSGQRLGFGLWGLHHLLPLAPSRKEALNHDELPKTQRRETEGRGVRAMVGPSCPHLEEALEALNHGTWSLPGRSGSSPSVRLQRAGPGPLAVWAALMPGGCALRRCCPWRTETRPLNTPRWTWRWEGE